MPELKPDLVSALKVAPSELHSCLHCCSFAFLSFQLFLAISPVERQADHNKESLKIMIVYDIMADVHVQALPL